jgi:translation initiation factor 3 subunit H
VLKIIKHCQENLPESIVTGQLLGMEVDRTLEVTNCFPYLQKNDETEGAETEDQGQDYQLEMMRNLREVNIDHDSVGWYSSTLMGTFVNDSTIDIQFNFQDRIKESVMIVYDPVKSSFGSLSLKAYRLTDAFMTLYRNKNFSKQRHAF